MTRVSLAVVAAGASVLLLGTGLTAAQWPQFRGPGGQGESNAAASPPRVERDQQRRVESARAGVGLVVAGRGRRPGVADDGHRGRSAEGRRVAASARIRRVQRARAGERGGVHRPLGERDQPEEQLGVTDADRRGRSRLRALRRRRDRGPRHEWPADLEVPLPVSVPARWRRLAGAAWRLADLQRRWQRQRLGHRARRRAPER